MWEKHETKLREDRRVSFGTGSVAWVRAGMGEHSEQVSAR